MLGFLNYFDIFYPVVTRRVTDHERSIYLKKLALAVLFDLDGVLIDSPPIHAWAWAEMFRPWGIELPPERLHREEGRKSEEIAAGILAEYDLIIPEPRLKELLNQKRSLYRSASPKGMRKDSTEAIVKLKQLGIKIGLVSGSARENVLGILTKEEIEYFDVLVTAEEYLRAKPDPEPYLTGCRRLNVPPAQTVAVENAPLGIQSAKSAGLFVVGVTTTLPASVLSNADAILSDLTGLVDLVSKRVN